MKYLEAIRGIIKDKNIIPKLASILLAVGFWAYISSIETGTLRFKVPLTYKNLDQNLAVSKASYKSILVEIRGSREDLKNASIKNLRLFVDLANAEPGIVKSYKVQEQKGEIPEGFDVEYDPPEVSVVVEKKVFRNVRIIPRYSGNVQKGFILGMIRANPEYVRIGGPEEVIRNIPAVYTENISVDDRNSTSKDIVKLEKSGDDEIEYGISKVSVTIPVLVYTNVMAIDVPVMVKNRKKGYRYTLKSSAVKLSIMTREGENIDSSIFNAYIDAYDIDFSESEFGNKQVVERTAEVQVRSASPDDENSIIQVSPLVIDVQISRE